MLQASPLYRLPGVMYAKEAPVVLTSGELLSDPQNGRFLVGLVFENLTDKVITAAKVRVTSLDPADRPTSDTMEFYYMDLAVPRNGCFGGDRYLTLTHPATRGFSFQLLEVIFADKTVWSGIDAVWEPLPTRIPLEEALDDAELVKQYRLRYGHSCRYVPLALNDLHLCSCGAVNLGHSPCRICGLTPTLLTSELLTSLRSDADIRLEREAEQRAEQTRLLALQQEEQRRLQEEQQRIAEEQRKLQEEENARKAEERKKTMAEYGSKLKKTGKKALKIAIWSAVSLVLVLAIYVASVLWIVPEVRYQNALKALDQKNYQEAHRLFTLLAGVNPSGDYYKDTEDYLDRFRVVEISSRSTSDCSGVDPDDLNSWDETSGSVTESKYDAHGNIIWEKTTDLALKNGKFVPDGEPSIDEDWDNYQYNSSGNPIKATHTDGSYTVYHYNSEGKLSKSEKFSKDGGTAYSVTEYAYDNDGNLVERTSENDHTTYTYDNDGNLTKSVYTYSFTSSYYSNNYTTTTTYDYDRKGRLTEAESRIKHPDDPDRDEKRTFKYEYDLAGRLVSVKYSSESNDYTSEQETSYTYNWRGDITSMEYKYKTLNDGEVAYNSTQSFTITYNLLGHLKHAEGTVKSTNQDGEKSTQKISAEIKCRADGSLEEVKVTAKGDKSENSYKETILYDENQNVISETTTFKNGKVTEYEYEYAYFYYPEGVMMPDEY